VLSALEVPADREQLSVVGLGEVEALRLLVDRAVAVAPDFMLTDENCGAASEICRRLDGMPLAIELAAVRLASLAVDDLRGRLDDRLRLLAAAPGIGPSRSQTLRATVDWSYGLLSEEERILWRRLSVFAGSFGLEAAEEVCSGAGLERERIVDLIAGLVSKSMLVMDRQHRRGRYRLLETLRLYGQQRLAQAGEDGELARRHAAWYAELISGGELPWWGTSRQEGMFDELDVEWANVEAALDFCTGSPPDAEMGLRIAADLWLYWTVRGRYRAGNRRLEALLEVAPTPTPTRAMALWALGFHSQATSDFSAALPAFEEARKVADETGGDRELAYAMFGLALAQIRLGNIEEARDWTAQSCERLLRVDDPYGLALCLYFMATAVATRRSAARRAAPGRGRPSSQRAGWRPDGAGHLERDTRDRRVAAGRRARRGETQGRAPDPEPDRPPLGDADEPAGLSLHRRIVGAARKSLIAAWRRRGDGAGARDHPSVLRAGPPRRVRGGGASGAGRHRLPNALGARLRARPRAGRGTCPRRNTRGWWASVDSGRPAER
jgi:tetratricopeptide (TPR) repeat protein